MNGRQKKEEEEEDDPSDCAEGEEARCQSGEKIYRTEKLTPPRFFHARLRGDHVGDRIAPGTKVAYMQSVRDFNYLDSVEIMCTIFIPSKYIYEHASPLVTAI